MQPIFSVHIIEKKSCFIAFPEAEIPPEGYESNFLHRISLNKDPGRKINGDKLLISSLFLLTFVTFNNLSLKGHFHPE